MVDRSSLLKFHIQINRALCRDTRSIPRTTTQLFLKTHNCPHTLQLLWTLLDRSDDPEIRECIAKLLKERLDKFKHWRKISVPCCKDLITPHAIFSTILKEPNGKVRSAMVELLTTIVRYEATANRNCMPPLIEQLCHNCRAADVKLCQCSAAILVQLVQRFRRKFKYHVVEICSLFQTVLVNALARDKNATTIMSHMLQCMHIMMIYVSGNDEAEELHFQSLGLMFKLIPRLDLVAKTDNFSMAMEIVELSFYHFPNMVMQHIKAFLQLCKMNVLNASRHFIVRIKLLEFLGIILELRLSTLLRMHAMHNVLRLLFNVIAMEPDCEKDCEYFAIDSKPSVMSTATTIVYTLLVHKHLLRFAKPFNMLVRTGLRSRSSKRRYAAFLALGMIVEHNIDYVRRKHLRVIIKVIENGLMSPNLAVRSGALFVLNQLSIHVRPGLSDLYIAWLFPIVQPAMRQFCKDLSNERLQRNRHHQKQIERIMYAICWYFYVWSVDVAPYFREIITGALRVLKNQHYSRYLRGEAFALLSFLLLLVEEQIILPWLPQMIAILHRYFAALRVDARERDELHGSVLGLLSSLLCRLSRESCQPLLAKIKTYALEELRKTECNRQSSELYELLINLAAVLRDNMQDMFPDIMQHMYATFILAHKNIKRRFKQTKIQGNQQQQQQQHQHQHKHQQCQQRQEDQYKHENHSKNNNIVVRKVKKTQQLRIPKKLRKTFLLHNNAEDDDGYDDDNRILIKVLVAFREFARYSPHAFESYLENAFHLVNQLALQKMQVRVRYLATATIIDLAIALYHKLVTLKEETLGINFLRITMIKLFEIIYIDSNYDPVIAAIRGLRRIWETASAPLSQIRELEQQTFVCLYGVLLYEVPSLKDARCNAFADQEATHEIFISAIKLLKYISTLSVNGFKDYFEQFAFTFVAELEDGSTDARRCIIYEMFCHSFKLLRADSSRCYELILPMLLKGVQDRMVEVRIKAVLGLGDLVLYSKDKAFGHYPAILNTLSDALRKEQTTCLTIEIFSTLAKLAVANSHLVPLERIMSYITGWLTTVTTYKDCAGIVECFEILYRTKLKLLSPYIPAIITTTLQILQHSPYEAAYGGNNDIIDNDNNHHNNITFGKKATLIDNAKNFLQNLEQNYSNEKNSFVKFADYLDERMLLAINTNNNKNDDDKYVDIDMANVYDDDDNDDINNDEDEEKKDNFEIESMQPPKAITPSDDEISKNESQTTVEFS